MDKIKVCKGNGRIGLGRELRFIIGWCAKAPLPEEIFEHVKDLWEASVWLSGEGGSRQRPEHMLKALR